MVTLIKRHEHYYQRIKVTNHKDKPVPEPMAPRKSARTESAPMQRPPKAAAVGM